MTKQFHHKALKISKSDNHMTLPSDQRFHVLKHWKIHFFKNNCGLFGLKVSPT